MAYANKEILKAIANKDYGEMEKLSDNMTALHCQDCTINVPIDGLVTIHASFVLLVGGHDSAEVISEAVRRVTYYLWSG